MSIVVAGHTGLVGSAIFELLEARGETVIGMDSRVCNLLDRSRTFDYVSDVKPSVIIDAAAIVGGIGANNSHPVEFLSMNLQIQANLMDAAHAARVERFVFLGSSCIYPRECPQPIKEEYLLTGPLEVTNSAYAIAKIAGIELIRSYRRQYKYHWISLMPTNTYGPRDNFNLEKGHVLPSLVNRFVSAAESGSNQVTLWGTGTPRREFLHSRDLAEATIFLMNNYDGDDHLNVGSGQDLSIKDLATLISREAGFSGKIVWNSEEPDGTPKKLLDVSKVKQLGWSPKVTLEQGIKETIQWFKENRDKVRL